MALGLYGNQQVPLLPVTAAVTKSPICCLSRSLPYSAACPLASISRFYLETCCLPWLFLAPYQHAPHWPSMEIWDPGSLDATWHLSQAGPGGKVWKERASGISGTWCNPYGDGWWPGDEVEAREPGSLVCRKDLTQNCEHTQRICGIEMQFTQCTIYHFKLNSTSCTYNVLQLSCIWVKCILSPLEKMPHPSLPLPSTESLSFCILFLWICLC